VVEEHREDGEAAQAIESRQVVRSSTETDESAARVPLAWLTVKGLGLGQ
jgi:hypothetical protein